jgi:hypothetical protein
MLGAKPRQRTLDPLGEGRVGHADLTWLVSHSQPGEPDITSIRPLGTPIRSDASLPTRGAIALKMSQCFDMRAPTRDHSASTDSVRLKCDREKSVPAD